MTHLGFLMHALEFSNGLTVFAGLICFVIMFLFVSRNMVFLRTHGAEDLMFPTNAVTRNNRKSVPKIDMIKVHIVFTMKLINMPSSHTANEIQCLISSKVNYCVQVLWGVNIRELHVNLWLPWQLLKMAFLDDNVLKNHYKFKTVHEIKSAHNDEVFTIKFPDVPLELGLPPRLCYPLVVILIRNDTEDYIHPDETVALVNVIHIKDSICTLPTSILSQYLKQANGQLSCLKQLYLATGNVMNYEKEEPHSLNLSLAEPLDHVSGDLQKAFVCQSDEHNSQTIWKSASTDQLCVVCQSFPLSRALLPCRHTCLCAVCFDKLDRCPLCRGTIESYFCIRNEAYLTKQSETDETLRNKRNLKIPRSLSYWFDHWNEAVVDFFGLPR